jgi:hypothetical protein
MIPPIQDVTTAPPLISYAICCAPWRGRRRRCWWIPTQWVQEPVPLWLLTQWALMHSEQARSIQELTAGGYALPARTSEPQPWTPWPAHPPFADEIERWWPSAEYPPLAPTPVIEDTQPDPLPAVILWPAAGGLLDTWV